MTTHSPYLVTIQEAPDLAGITRLDVHDDATRACRFAAASEPGSARLGTPDTLNIAVFSVDGDASFGTLITFLHALGIRWAVVCDGAVYKFGTGKKQIFEQAASAGVEDQRLQHAAGQGTSPAAASFRELRDAKLLNHLGQT